jgi:hypothetical protein
MGERMTKTDLDKWRFLAPFIIVSSTLIPLVYVFIMDSYLEEKIIQIIVTPTCYILAFFYSAMKLRNPFWARELNKYVGAQIKTELIKLVPDNLNITSEEKIKLKEKEIWKKLTGVFWEAIDSDPILIKQKEHFYTNGVLYTTSIDLFLILPFVALIYLILYFFIITNTLFLCFGVLCFLVSLFSRYLALPSCRKRHLELSTEQLELLRRNKKDFIAGKFKEIIEEWRLEKV